MSENENEMPISICLIYQSSGVEGRMDLIWLKYLVMNMMPSKIRYVCGVWCWIILIEMI